MEDHELLTRYLHQGEEEAFTTLVQKYTDFVYSAAVRQLNNRMLAEEVVQTVFLTLTRKAHRIRGNIVLSGWLHRATRFACLEIARAESRRHQREDGFGRMAAPGGGSEESVDSRERTAPLLDEAIQSLSSREQETIFLRFFEDKSYQAIAEVHGETEVAAKKRVSRSLERLRKFFARRGVLIASATLGQTLAARAVESAPTGLAAQVGSLAGRGAVVGPSTLELVSQTIKAMAWSQWKWSLVSSLVVVGLSIALASRAYAREAGSLDGSFRPTTQFNLVNTVLVQPDGKAIIAGVLESPVGNPSPNLDRGIVRLHPDGSRDRTFASFDEKIMTAALQADGKILVGGSWLRTNQVKRANISRLNADGTLDATFDPGPGTDWDGDQAAVTRFVARIIVQPDQRILVSGNFGRIAGEPMPGLARLHPDGTLDRSFVPSALPGDGFGRPVLQPDGKILAWAGYPSMSGGVVPHLVRLNADGSLDRAFALSKKTSRMPGDPSELLAVQSTGKILAVVQFDLSRSLIRLHEDGTRDTGFAPRIQWIGDPGNGVPTIEKVVVDARDRILVTGRFTRVNGVERNGICRLQPDGALDLDFGGGLGIGPRDRILVRAITLDAQGRILVGGSGSTTYQGIAQRGVVRLWGEPALRFGPLVRVSEGLWLATVTTLLESPILIQVSGDLTHWDPLTRLTNGPGQYSPVDPFMGMGPRFYRALVER